ncbi:MAG: amino acid ABC transporter ATP-binding protein [Puniceicoccales bacterium]|jgi:ABC-type polar amino acid transport system ATPase subunit|nr:amino acid ABC transporter ATP-binding protein [Puniceicoccales bacterium]
MLRVNDIHCKFGDSEVLRGVSFSVDDGEIATVIGGSGAGKTTLMRLLCGLEKISSGSVSINGHPAKAGEYGLVQQGCCLFEHMTLLGNVSYALEVVKKFPRARAVAIASEMLGRFGLADRANCYPSVLSGGQRQRVAIARTLVMNPRILLFDEPTSALDPEMTTDVIMLIKTIAADGISVLIVTHDLTMAKKISDKILFLDNGKIIEDRPAKDFFAHPVAERARSFLKNAACS